MEVLSRYCFLTSIPQASHTAGIPVCTAVMFTENMVVCGRQSKTQLLIPQTQRKQACRGDLDALMVSNEAMMGGQTDVRQAEVMLDRSHRPSVYVFGTHQKFFRGFLLGQQHF